MQSRISLRLFCIGSCQSIQPLLSPLFDILFSTIRRSTMSISLLRSSLLRRGQPSAFSTASALRFNSSSSTQPLKPAHPADVVSGNVSGPPTVHEMTREIAAEVVSDAPSESYRQCTIDVSIPCRFLLVLYHLSGRKLILAIRRDATSPSPDLPTH